MLNRYDKAFKKLDKIERQGLNKVLETASHNEIRETLKKLGFDIPEEVLNKVPKLNWKPELSRTLGIKFNEYSGKSDSVKNSIRISKGNPDAMFDSQRVDYVKIVRDGKVIGRNGREIHRTPEYERPSEHPDPHIPMTEWKEWRK